MTTWVRVDLVGQLVTLPLPMWPLGAFLGVACCLIAAALVVATVGERRR